VVSAIVARSDNVDLKLYLCKGGLGRMEIKRISRNKKKSACC